MSGDGIRSVIGRRELVETGVRAVGEHGVEGSIEKFKDADIDDGWMPLLDSSQLVD